MQRVLDPGRCLNPGMGIAVIDATLNVLTMVNPEFARMHGYAVDEMRGMPSAALLAPEERASLPSIIAEAEAHGEYRFRTRTARKDGSTFPVQVDLAVVRDVNGDPIRRIGVVVDLDRAERSRAIAEGSARAMEEVATAAPLAAVLESITLMIEAADPEVRCSVLLIDRNGPFLRSVAGARLPQAYTNAVDGLRFGEGVGSCGTAAHRGERVIVEDVRSSPLWAPYLDIAKLADIYACWAEPIRSPDGKVCGTFSMYYRQRRAPRAEDFSLLQTAAHLAGIAIGRRRTEEDLEEEKERYRTLVEYASEAIAVLDVGPTALTIAEANPRACALLAVPRERVIGSYFHAWSAATQPGGMSSIERMDELLRATRRGEVPEAEWALRDGDGAEIPCEVRLVMLPSSGGERVRVCIDDIRARKRDELARRALEERGRNAQRLESLGLLAGGVAHDFNNLLVGVLGNASLALMDLPEDSPARESVLGIELAARRAADLAAEMIAYSGRSRQNREPVDVSFIVEQTLPLIRSQIPVQAKVELDLCRGSAAIEADPTQVRQIVMNLVSNAAQAIGSSRGHLRIRTDVAYLDRDALAGHTTSGDVAPGTFVVLEVIDDGCGMDDATRERIFDPFFTTRLAGRGLGLASVQGIVRGHHGAIMVESRPGEGTTFKVLLPASAVAMETRSEPVRSAATPSDAQGQSVGTILVVDDEPAVTWFCQMALTRAGYQVLVCASGMEALDRVASAASPPDAAVVDLMMPGISGDDTIQRLRRICPGLPAILSSGYRRNEPGIAAMRRDVPFLAKPYTAGELLDAVRGVIRAAAIEVPGVG